MMMTNASEKASQIRTLQLRRMNQMAISLLKQELLYLKEDLSEFLEDKKIKNLIKKHSEFVVNSINLYCEKQRKKKLMMITMKTKQAMKKRRKSQQSNINRNMLTKTKYY
jgi:HSP90 family molecular chaperone